MKEVKLAVAVYLVNPANEQEFLAVKRPVDAHSLPGVWGLPAVTLRPGESVTDGIKRVGEEKLSTIIEPEEFLGVKAGDRASHHLVLMDFKAKLVGQTPSVKDGVTDATKYEDQQWTSDVTILREAASKGSLCSQIILDRLGLKY
jgi:ADP-ribose pyrophosphatase YjhB (NUDIX family)